MCSHFSVSTARLQMNHKRIIIFALLVSFLCASLLTLDTTAQSVRRPPVSHSSAQTTAARARTGGAVNNFNELVAAYRRDHTAFHPTEAIEQTLALPAANLEMRSPAALDVERRRLRDVIARLERTRTWLLPMRLKTEWSLIGAHARANLLEIEGREVWRREPHRYVNLITAGADRVLRHPTASADEKLQLFLRRSNETKRLLNEARGNLDAPPRVFTEAGIADARLAARFFRDTVPQLFGRAGGAGMSASRRADFDRANREVARDLRLFAEWLEQNLLPRSTGKIGAGADVLRGMLRVEGIETSLDELARRGEVELRAVQDRMRIIAEDVAPGRGVAGALDELRRERPTATGLVGEARVELDRIGVFLRANDLFPIPARLSFSTNEMPLYLRARRLNATEIAAARADQIQMRLLVTPPDGGLNLSDAAAHLAFFNRYTLPFIAINSALPGALSQLPGKTFNSGAMNASIASRLVADGWAHYCEQAMLDAGFGGNNPKYELAQLHLRQLNLCRYLTALALHRDQMSYDGAVRFFIRDGNLEPTLAARFARDVALDPLALAATLGKQEIEELRAAARRRGGVRFRPQEFHEAVLGAGNLPLPLLRTRVMERLSGVEGAEETDSLSGDASIGTETRNAISDSRQDLEVNFTVLAIGSMSDYEGGRALQLITDLREFSRIWRTLGGGGNLPNVNFETRSVILVQQGQRTTGGYSIEVRGVRQTDGGLVVQVNEQKPNTDGFVTQVITSPFVLVSVPRFNSGTPVRFADEARARSEASRERKAAPNVRRQIPARRNRPRAGRRKGVRP